MKNNNLTIKNIRLWDQEPLLKTNRRRYYKHYHYRWDNLIL
ncbi:MAG: hypothetical protein ACKO86_27055 [Dolichospermum sp.]